MARSTRTKPKAKSTKAGDSPSGNRRSVVLVLAGATAFAVLAMAAFAFLSTAGGGGANFTPNDRGLLPAGAQAPDFTAETVGGGDEVSVGGDAGATMLVFFATWCPHCNDEAPVVSQLEEEYEDLSVVMVGIDGQDDPEKVREFVDRYGIESPAVYKPSLGPAYRVSGYPTTYVLDGEGEVAVAHSGEAPREVYEAWIEEALEGGA